MTGTSDKLEQRAAGVEPAELLLGSLRHNGQIYQMHCGAVGVARDPRRSAAPVVPPFKGQRICFFLS